MCERERERKKKKRERQIERRRKSLSSRQIEEGRDRSIEMVKSVNRWKKLVVNYFFFGKLK